MALALSDFANFARTTVATPNALNNTTNPITLDVVDGAVYGTITNGMDVTISSSADPMNDAGREVARITARTVNSITLSRPNAVTHTGSPYIFNGVVAAEMRRLEDAVAAVEASAGSAASKTASNTFTETNPIITPAESWIGPADTTGVYFKSGNIGIGSTSPAQKLTVTGNAAISDNGSYMCGTAKALTGVSSKYSWYVGTGGNVTHTGMHTFGAGHTALASLTTGNNNVGIGYKALNATTTGGNNVAVGNQALMSNVTGGYNIGIGYNCLLNSTGNSNTCVGSNVMSPATATGSFNSVLGSGALSSNNYGENNAAVGYGALYATNASNNVAVGGYAGFTNTSGNLNTFLGYYAGYHASQVASVVNSTAIGSNTYTTASNQMVLGDGSVNVGIGFFSEPQARLHLPAGAATAKKAPLMFTSGTNLTSAAAGAVEYNGRFYVTETGNVRRFVVQAAASTKTTTGAPFTNDGYVEIVIDGTTLKIMTTA